MTQFFFSDTESRLAGLPARECRRPSRPQLDKPRKAIHICVASGGLGLIDRKLFNCLLHYAARSRPWSDEKPAEPVVFIARTQDLRQDVGLHPQAGNAQFLKSLKNLCRQPVIFPEIVREEEQAPLRSPLIEDFHIKKGQGYLKWTFPRELLPTRNRIGPDGNIEPWAELDVDVCAQFGSKYALSLYELMSLLPKRNAPRITYSLVDLRCYLGVGCPNNDGSGKLEGWNALRSRALEPAIAEVNRLAAFAVKMEPKKGFGRRAIAKVSFEVST